MVMKWKRWISALLVVVMVSLSCSLTANASSAPKTGKSAAGGTVSPMYVQINEVINGLEVSGNLLKLTADTFGYFNADRCEVWAKLQYWTGSFWQDDQVWYKASHEPNLDYVLFYAEVHRTPGQYRLVTIHAVTVGNTTEYEQMTSPTRTIY